MIIFTVYTLYLDDNLWNNSRMDFIFGHKIFFDGLEMKIQTKVEAVSKFYIFNFGIKHDHFDSLYTVSR